MNGHHKRWAPTRRVSAKRAAVMARLYKGGYTLQEIGDIQDPPISRERVRQLLRKYTATTAHDGGKAVLAKRRRESKHQKAETACLRKYGCTRKQLRGLRKTCQELLKAGHPPCKSPVAAFTTQKANAKKRGIEWRLKLWEWWQIWQASGRWEERGRGQGYVMGRFGDSGAYEIGNVSIISAIENSSERKQKKNGLPCGVSLAPANIKNPYVAHRMFDGKTHYLGAHKTPERAAAAYLAFTPPGKEAA